MRRFGFISVTFILLLYAGCVTTTAPYVAVREARFRSETTHSDRLKLPLDEESRIRLIAFLRAGGDTYNMGDAIVDIEAEWRYEPLLEMLSDARDLTLEDLLEKQTFSDWFTDEVVRQVIDAREESPPAIDPVAVTDGRYWWIFYHHHKKLTYLLVVKAIPKKIER